MFLSRDYPLVVVAQKFDDCSENKYLLQTVYIVKFSGGNYQPLNMVPRENHSTVFTVQD